MKTRYVALLVLASCFPQAHGGLSALPPGSYHEIPLTAPREIKLGPLSPVVQAFPALVVNSHDVESIATKVVGLDAPVTFAELPEMGQLPTGSRVGFYNAAIEWVVLGDAATIYGKALPAHSIIGMSPSSLDVIVGSDFSLDGDHLHAGDRLESWARREPRPSSIMLHAATSFEGKPYHPGDTVYFTHGRVQRSEGAQDRQSREHQEIEQHNGQFSACYSTCQGGGGDYNECARRCGS